MKAHTHRDAGHAHLRSESGRPVRVLHEIPGENAHAAGGGFNSNPVGIHTGTGRSNISEALHENGQPMIRFQAQETAPMHMDVVWIMRIK